MLIKHRCGRKWKNGFSAEQLFLFLEAVQMMIALALAYWSGRIVPLLPGIFSCVLSHGLAPMVHLKNGFQWRCNSASICTDDVPSNTKIYLSMFVASNQFKQFSLLWRCHKFKAKLRYADEAKNRCLCLISTMKNPPFHDPINNRFAAKGLLILITSISVATGFVHSKLISWTDQQSGIPWHKKTLNSWRARFLLPVGFFTWSFIIWIFFHVSLRICPRNRKVIGASPNNNARRAQTNQNENILRASTNMVAS